MALCALLKSEGRNQKSDPAVAGPKPEEHNSRADFPLANATARALNSIMSEDAAITPPNDSLSDIIASAARRKTYVLTLLLGVALGALVGILNVLAAHYQWTLQDDFFDIVDAPIDSLQPGSSGLVWIVASFGLSAMSEAFVMICYWSAIGLFLASLFCLVWTGDFRDITRDKICRYMLFFGTFAGIFIGSLGFLAAANGWEDLDIFFNSLNHPVTSVVDALQARYDIPPSSQSGSQSEFILGNTVVVVYWTIIGSLLALLPCVVRLFRKRKAARERQVARGMILLCRSGASGQTSNQRPIE